VRRDTARSASLMPALFPSSLFFCARIAKSTCCAGVCVVMATIVLSPL
jgi:hypothetical protein